MNIILKVTKHCNMRCRYCYEHPYHNRSSAMSLGDIETIFQKLRRYFIGQNGRVGIEFIWHGGEPMLLPPSFYWNALDLEEKYFPSGKFVVNNGIQTNLTLLDEDYVKLFKTGRMGTIGVSFDVINSNRIFRNGRSTYDCVVENFEILRQNGILHNAICVLTKQNIDHIDEIYHFFADRDICFHLIPSHHLGVRKSRSHAIMPGQFAKAAQRLFDLWFYDRDTDIVISDFSHMIVQITGARDGASSCYFNKDCVAQNMHIDPDGAAYTCTRMNFGRYAYGNIFEQSVSQLMDSPARKMLMNRYKTIETECGHCEFFKICNGGCMNMGRTQGNFLRKSVMCVYFKTMFSYIRKRLRQHDLITKSGSLRSDYKRRLAKVDRGVLNYY